MHCKPVIFAIDETPTDTDCAVLSSLQDVICKYQIDDGVSEMSVTVGGFNRRKKKSG